MTNSLVLPHSKGQKPKRQKQMSFWIETERYHRATERIASSLVTTLPTSMTLSRLKLTYFDVRPVPIFTFKLPVRCRNSHSGNARFGVSCVQFRPLKTPIHQKESVRNNVRLKNSLADRLVILNSAPVLVCFSFFEMPWHDHPAEASDFLAFSRRPRHLGGRIALVAAKNAELSRRKRPSSSPLPGNS
jgi:hypothetical protein